MDSVVNTAPSASTAEILNVPIFFPGVVESPVYFVVIVELSFANTTDHPLDTSDTEILLTLLLTTVVVTIDGVSPLVISVNDIFESAPPGLFNVADNAFIFPFNVKEIAEGSSDAS